jgi:hypothetical protein
VRILSVGIIVVLCLTGCESSKQSRENNALSERYQQKMDKGETTPEQDKSFIRASTRAWYEMDAALRGRKKADATKAQAKALDNPINLDVK